MPDGGDIPSSESDPKLAWLKRFLGFSKSAGAGPDDRTKLALIMEMLDSIEAEIKAGTPNLGNLNVIKAELTSASSSIFKGLKANSSPDAPAQANRAMMLLDAVNARLLKSDLDSAQAELDTLRKRVAAASTQPVGERVRLLTNYQQSLNAPGPIAALKTGKGDAVAALNAKIATFDGEITSQIAAARREAMATIEAHADEWTKALTAAATGSPKDMLAAITAAEKGILEDGGLAKRLGLDVAKIHAGVKLQADQVRGLYAKAIPTRTSEAPPGDPLVAVKKPALGNTEMSKELGDLISETEGAMSAGGKPDPAKVGKHVAEIQKLVDCPTAEAKMRELGSWDAAKAAYKTMTAAGQAAEAKKMMSELWWYRRQLVDGTMLELQKKYDFTWGSVGSANLESDYDVTVRTHGKQVPDPADKSEPPSTKPCKYDYEIVEEFNRLISSKFGGTAPGIVFDTNLYAEAVPDEKPAWGWSPIAGDMKAMRESGQDVGALMKLRRFMDEEEYQTYMEGVLKPLQGDPAAYKTMKTQFEEADANYQIARLAQLEATAGSGNPNQSPAKDGPEKGAIEKQLATLHAGEELDEDGATAMATNNKLYLEALAEARKIEEKLVKAESPADKDALFTQLKGMQARATFFAAEAYHSEGPLKHVVQAAQSSAVAVNADDSIPKEKKAAEIKKKTDEAMAKLSATQLLQSFNENNGDLLKDIKHYEHASPFPGLGFYRCSKYLERMCDAAEWIAKNLKDPAQKSAIEALKIGGKTPSAVKAGVGGLVAIRGGKKEFQGVSDAEAEKEAYAVEEMKNVFSGVTTLRDLAAVANAYSSEVNALVRGFEAQSMQAKNSAAFFKTGKEAA